MTDPAPLAARPASQTDRLPPGFWSLWLLWSCTTLILLLLLSTTAGVILNLRDAVVGEAETTLRNLSIVLAEQADRSLQALDLVLSGVIVSLPAEGVPDADSVANPLATERIHDTLQDKISGLPYVNAITLVDPHGNLVNFSRYWPIPKVNIADRDYFRAMVADPSLDRFISVPVPNRGDGTWTIYLARRVKSADGAFAGLVLGAVELRYFEDLYRSVSNGSQKALSLLRDDGVLLIRYPSPAGSVIGQTLQANSGLLALSGRNAGVIHDVSPIDGLMRVKAAQHLANFPLALVATETEQEALIAWRNTARMIVVVSIFCCIAILVAAMAITRWWRHQQVLGRAWADRAETARALAQAEADLMREREQAAERISTAKSDFLASMSHEIRTPLNAVLGLAGLLLDGDLPAAQRKLVRTIHESGESLLLILNDILDFSKLDARCMQFESMGFSPGTLTESIASILAPRAAAKGLILTTHLDPALPSGLAGDAGRIRQVLLNLTSNALKFTEIGRVVLSVRVLAREAGGITLEWVVRDSGIGIAPDRLGALFSPFAQADSSITRRFGGSGLGLAICKRLVEAMGGTIGVESTAGEGSNFHFQLTLPHAELTAMPIQEQDSAAGLNAHIARLGRRLRVLFAEDNPTNQFVAQQMLKGFPVQVDIAGNGIEAVAATTRASYDLICMDVSMPDMDGLAATRAIRALPAPTRSVPIIALTANAFPEDVRACLAAGMNDFLAKPVSKQSLIAAILRAIRLEPAAPVQNVIVADDAVCDEAGLAALAHDLSHSAVAELAALFLDETRARLQRMADPRMEPATLLREAHTLKGGARTVRAMHLGNLAAAMEDRMHAGGAVSRVDIDRLETAFAAFAERIGQITHQAVIAA